MLYERYPSQYDNLSEEELQPTPPFPLFTPISPMPQTNGVFVTQFVGNDNLDGSNNPPPLPEKKSRHSMYKKGKKLGCNKKVAKKKGIFK